MVVIPEGSTDCELIVVTEKGYGKRTKISEYKTQNRGGSGIKTYKVTDKTGGIITAQIQHRDLESDLLIATISGQVIRMGTKQVPLLGRDTMGVRLIKLDASDTATSVAILDTLEIEEE
jgi:DNA gyrase subunit A